MSARPLLIVTLTGRSVAACREEALRGARAGADVAEVRLDRWPATERAAVATLFPSPVPLLATYRSRAEGGEGEDDPALRGSVLAACRTLPFRFVDWEEARDPLPATAAPGAALLLSRHYGAPCTAEEIATQLAPPPAAASLRKVVAPATVEEFLRDWFPRLTKGIPAQVAPMTTGTSGSLARIWAPRFGSAAVFARLPWSDPASPPVESSQPPVDQMRRVVDSDHPEWFALVGSPVAHSLSPRIHSEWLARELRPASYSALDVSTQREVQELCTLGREGWWAGWNVTHPWKRLAASLADERSEAVDATGGANTLTFREGQVSATQTDVDAIRRRTRELRGSGHWSGAEALVVGTGGAARAAVYALGIEGAAVWVSGRDTPAVGEICERLSARPLSQRAPGPVELTVHATLVGRERAGRLTPSIDDRLGRGTTLLDFVYAPEDAQLARAAERAGATYEDGRRLLVYQAAASHGTWWGAPPDETAILGTLRSVGCAA